MQARTDNPQEMAPGASRRGLFAGLGRWAAALTLGGLAIKLFTGRRGAGQNHSCDNQGFCRACGRYDDCILPQAQSARQLGLAPRTVGESDSRG
jgi:hypothetical protein